MQSLIQYRRLRQCIDHRSSRTSKASQPQQNKISFDKADEGDLLTSPRDWPDALRHRVFALVWILVFTQGWISTCTSLISTPASEALHVSKTAYSLATALFFLGIAIGALVGGPLSETFGRSPIYLSSTFLMLCFTLGSALAPNFGALIVLRFLSGLASSPTLSIYGGTLADTFTSEERRNAWPWFAISALLGLVFAPVAGGWISGNIDWRWTLWIGLAFSGAAFVVALLFLPETFSPVLLHWQERQNPHAIQDGSFLTPTEISEETLTKRLVTNASRPFVLWTSEPIIIFLGLYLVLISAINFSFLNGLDFIFLMNYGLSEGLTSLDFISIALGVLIDVAMTPLYRRLGRQITRRQNSAFDKHAGPEKGSPAEIESQLPPEMSLLRATLAAPFLPMSLFWLGWTNYPRINPASGYVATVLFGYCFSAIFISGYQYIIDAYEQYSSSALASITVARYFVSAGIIVATIPWYQGIGVHWVMTILGSFTFLMIPVPWLLWRYGPTVRAKSDFAREIDPENQ